MPVIMSMYLSFLQGSLDFRLLLLNLLLDFLQLMNRLSSLCNLLREVRNLLCREEGTITWSDMEHTGKGPVTPA